MSLLDALASSPRLLVAAKLRPLQTPRFQPTGFPDLGAAAYMLPDSTQMLLVESAQSVANRLETAIWDGPADDLVPALQGMPYVRVCMVDGAGTNSILEAHRLNSPYILKGGDTRVFDLLQRELDTGGRSAVDRGLLARTVFRIDPNAVLHGVFLAEKDLAGGRHRLTRALSGFIEAEDVRPAESGGVKNDRIDPSGDTRKGFGNVPFHRTEYVARTITASFNLDLALIRSYGLPDVAREFLAALALYKIHRFLGEGLRLRSACDLEPAGSLTVQRPDGLTLPGGEDLARRLPELVRACSAEGLFVQPPVTELEWREARKRRSRTPEGEGPS